MFFNQQIMAKLGVVAFGRRPTLAFVAIFFSVFAVTSNGTPPEVGLLSSGLNRTHIVEETQLKAVRLDDGPPTCLEQKSPCSCKTDQGLIDLSPINSNDPTKPYFHDVVFSADTYTFNPCTPFSGAFQCLQAAACDCYSITCLLIGTHSSAVFKTDTDTQKLTIEYSAGGIKTIVTLVCDQSENGKLEAFNTFSPYKFTLTSKYACPGKGGGGGGGSGKLSIGSILLIVFFSVVGLYLVGGILYMHFAKGAVGIEKIPNIEFWKEVPSSIKDGVSFAITPIRSRTTGYETM